MGSARLSGLISLEELTAIGVSIGIFCALEGSVVRIRDGKTGRGRCEEPGWSPKPGSRKIRAPRVNAKVAGLVRKRALRPEASPSVLTIGHSARPLHEFIRLLQAHGVTRVVDVRTVPRSRHNPQFNKTSLPTSLQKVGLGYVHLSGLGGLRRPVRDSVNLGWRNASFRGYADYMQTLAHLSQFLAHKRDR